jgi:hypothetical protein
MAIFTKNKNPKALLGNQKLFKICCDDLAPDPCCYSTELPRPELLCKECGINIGIDYVVNGVNIGFVNPIIVNNSDIPLTLEIFFKNENIECNANFEGSFLSTTNGKNFSTIVQNVFIVEPLETILVATIEVPGPLIVPVQGLTLSPSISYSICDNNKELLLDILVNL